jgi:tight adherence protein B
MILAAAVAVALLVFACAYPLVRRRGERRLSRRLAPFENPRHGAAADAAAIVAASGRFRRLPGWSRFADLLDRADVDVPAARLVAAALAVAAAVAALALAAGLPPAGVAVLLVVGAAAARVWLGVRVTRRRRAFDDQLPEVLHELAGAMRAGHGFDQALQGVAADAADPAGKELARVLAETRLGRPIEEALAGLGRRIASEDLEFVLDAVAVQRQVGGSLAGVFEVVSETVRHRHQYVLRLRSLTALGRISALVLIALPVVAALGLSALDHSYLVPVLRSPGGRLALIASAGLLVFGSVWLRRIASLGGKL